MISAALALASLGWRVFALQPRSKLPATPHGCKDASADANALRGQWGALPCNVGVATGIESDVWVLDVDGEQGETQLGLLRAVHGDLPETVEATTGRGRHVYFRYPGAECPVRNSAGKLGAGLDVRADGGYVVAPPSVHPSGELYRWVRSPHDTPVAPAPDWLLKLVVDRPKAQPSPLPYEPQRTDGNTRYGATALDAECRELAATPEGQRNDRLNVVAFRVGQLARAGHLDEANARREVLAAAKACGLKERESGKTLDSGFGAGWKSPNPNDPDPKQQPPRARPYTQQAGAAVDPQAGDEAPPADEAKPAADAIPILSAQETAQRAYEYLLDSEARKRLPRFGFDPLNDAIGGMPPGSMLVLGGSTGSGKSSVALSIAINQALQQSIQVGYISLEDPEWVVGARVLGQTDDVDPSEFFADTPTAVMVERARRGVANAAGIGVHFAFPIGGKIERVLATARAFIKRGCRVIVVDYLQAISARGEDRYHARTDHAQMLKELCHGSGVPLMLLSQVKRQDGNAFREPTMNDLKDSGDIENMSEAIIVLWKDGDTEDANARGKVAKVKWSPRRPRFLIERKRVSGAVENLRVYVEQQSNGGASFGRPVSRGGGYG